MENARTKSRAQFVEEYGVGNDDPAEVRAHLDMLRRDPRGYVETLWRVTHGGAPPSQAEPAQPAQPVRLPEPALTSVDGQKAYSADQMLELLNIAATQIRHEIRQEFSGELQPLRDMHQEARIAKVRADAQAYAGEAVREAQTWHRFTELTPRIRELMIADKRTTLLSAYNRALQEDLQTSTKKLKDATRQETLDEIKQASAANTIRPGVTATATSSSRPRKGGLDAQLDRAISAALSSTSAAR